MPSSTKTLQKSLGKRRPQRAIAPRPKEAAPRPQEMPERYSRVILHLENGTQVRGVWTGCKWWAAGGEVHPVRWQHANAPRKEAKEKGAPAEKKKAPKRNK